MRRFGGSAESRIAIDIESAAGISPTAERLLTSDGEPYVEQKSSGGALIGSAIILGIAIVGSSFLLSSSLDRASERFGSALAAIKDFKPQPTAAAPSRNDGRPDPNKVYEVAIGNAPFIGPEDAKVSIVEFSDFQ